MRAMLVSLSSSYRAAFPVTDHTELVPFSKPSREVIVDGSGEMYA